jgi:hypothetical protein
VLSLAMKHPESQVHQPIERVFIQRRDRGRKRSMVKAGALMAVALGGAFALFLGRRK